MAARGIDGNDIEQQVKACEERGKQLLEEYKAQKGENRLLEPKECEDILEPIKGAFQLMENALNMTGTIGYFFEVHIFL